VAGDVSSDAACRSRALGAHCTPAIYHWTQQLKKQPACGQTASLQTRCLLLGLRCMLSVDIGLTLGARVNSVVTVSEYCVQRRWRLGGPSPVAFRHCWACCLDRWISNRWRRLLAWQVLVPSGLYDQSLPCVMLLLYTVYYGVLANVCVLQLPIYAPHGLLCCITVI